MSKNISASSRKRTLASPAGFQFDAASAARAVGFFADVLRHTKGEWAGGRFILAPWQERIVRDVFGWKRPDGTRRYRRVYIEVPRKNGKSTLAAGLALYLLYADQEAGAEVYSAAADRDQAGIVFEQAKAMAELEPELVAVSEIYRRSIMVPSTGSSYRVLSADVPTKHGLNAHGVLFDELHAQPTRDLWDVLTTSTGARRQPLVVAITTAGFDRQSVCWEVHEYARQVRDGIIADPSFLPVIYAAEPGDGWTAEATWRKANPGLGITVKLEYLRDECRRAIESPAYQNTFRRFHLSEWTEQQDRWIDLGVWAENGATIAEAELAGRRCFAGLDLSSTTDLSALVLLFPLDDGRYATLCRFWLPSANLGERIQRDRVPYDAWARDGFLELTGGNVVDYDVIRARVNELARRFEIRELAIDRWNATQLSTQLAGDGLMVVPFGQGFASMAAPTKEFMNLLLGRRLLHGGQPVLTWMAANVAVQQDAAGNLKPDKAKSTARIDGIVAVVMALDRATRAAVPDSGWRPI